MQTFIYQELKETTNAQIEYVIGFGGKLRLTTDLDLSGNGITLTGDGSNHLRGKKTYYATKLAFDKLKVEFTTCYMALL